MSISGGFGIYIHWPFCLSKCPYCDFNSYAATDEIDQTRWQVAMLKELETASSELTPKQRLNSIYFGGGTPSLMDPETVELLINQATAIFDAAPDIEITLEANPSTAEIIRFADFRQAGINRLSIGVQSFNDERLQWLKRTHDAQTAMRALEMASRFFPRYSFDLIYALPGQTEYHWQQDLQQALRFVSDHLSVYQLTIEPGCQWWHAGTTIVSADEAIALKLFESTQEILEKAGMSAYEISNHARRGAESRHNLVYWRGGEYLGIGPGAHSRVTVDGFYMADQRIADPKAWLVCVEKKGQGRLERIALANETRQRELLMVGLRLTEGVHRDRFMALTGVDPLEVLDGQMTRELEEAGFLEIAETTIHATAAGRQRLNAILAALLT